MASGRSLVPRTGVHTDRTLHRGEKSLRDGYTQAGLRTQVRMRTPSRHPIYMRPPAQLSERPANYKRSKGQPPGLFAFPGLLSEPEEGPAARGLSQSHNGLSSGLAGPLPRGVSEGEAMGTVGWHLRSLPGPAGPSDDQALGPTHPSFLVPLCSPLGSQPFTVSWWRYLPLHSFPFG